MHDALQPAILAAAVVFFLSWAGRATRHRPNDDECDRALCAAAMVQAAWYDIRCRMPDTLREEAVRSILRFDAVSVENTLGGRHSLQFGLRGYLRLAELFVAGYRDTLVLNTISDYLHAARRLRGRRYEVQRSSLFDALREAQLLADKELQSRLAELARSLPVRPRTRQRTFSSDDSALIWLYGIRAAWLWYEIGGGYSPFFPVSRRRLAAIRMLLLKPESS